MEGEPVRRPTKILLGAAAVGAIGVTAGIALAAIPGADGTIQGCYKKSNGQLRVVEASADCRRSEVAISWSQKGQKGDPGAAGAPGSPGTPGTNGVNGKDGPPGKDGVDGKDGQPGKDGTNGTNGVDGKDGKDGLPGPPGPPGPSGADPTADAFVNQFGTNTGNATAANGDTCTLGEILLSASPIRTAGGVPASGQLLPINQNTALFALIGTTYGGNGTTTFALPDLRPVTPNNMTYSICIVGIFPSTN
jgi:hypothetical protein